MKLIKAGIELEYKYKDILLEAARTIIRGRSPIIRNKDKIILKAMVGEHTHYRYLYRKDWNRMITILIDYSETHLAHVDFDKIPRFDLRQ